MVLESCELCTKYWINHGRDMSGYKFLMRDQHIPDAHPAPLMLTQAGESSSSQAGAIVVFEGAGTTLVPRKVRPRRAQAALNKPNANDPDTPVQDGKKKTRTVPSTPIKSSAYDDYWANDPYSKTKPYAVSLAPSTATDHSTHAKQGKKKSRPPSSAPSKSGVDDHSSHGATPKAVEVNTQGDADNVNSHPATSTPVGNIHFHQPLFAPFNCGNIHSSPNATNNNTNFHSTPYGWPASNANFHSVPPIPFASNVTSHPRPPTSFGNNGNFHLRPTTGGNFHQAQTAPFGSGNFHPNPLVNANFYHAQVPFFDNANFFHYVQAPFGNENFHNACAQPPYFDDANFHQTQTAPPDFHPTQTAPFTNANFHPTQTAPSGNPNSHSTQAAPCTNRSFHPAHTFAQSGNANSNSAPAAQFYNNANFRSATTASSESIDSDSCGEDDWESNCCPKCLDYLHYHDNFEELFDTIKNGQHIPEAHESDEDEHEYEDSDEFASSESEHEGHEEEEIGQYEARDEIEEEVEPLNNNEDEVHHISNQIRTSVDHEDKEDKKTKHDPSWYFQLYKAAMDGDWKSGKPILQSLTEEARRAKIRGNSETVLHVAVGRGTETTFFVRKLLNLLFPGDLEVFNKDGYTPLGIAAKVGNVEAAKLLVAKNPKSLYIPSRDGSFPIHNAAKHGKKEMLHYLLDVTEEGQDPDPYDPKVRDSELLSLVIRAEFYEAALLLLKRVPQLSMTGKYANTALNLLAENPAAFSCGRNGGFFKTLLYDWIPDLQNKQPDLHKTRDIEIAVDGEISNTKSLPNSRIRCIVSGREKIHQVLWRIFERVVPHLKSIRSEKLKAQRAKKLVKSLCEEAAKNLEKSSKEALMFKMSLMVAAQNGIQEIVKEITYSFPHAIWYHDDNNSEVFRLAIENRQHEVYNMLFEMGDMYKNIVWESENGDTILHLAGCLAPSLRLSDVSGAALQMQRELQWFKEIESIVQPAHKLKRNKEGLTPQEVFTESHRPLMADGEKWMRETATSCTVAASLIATVVFAAAITVPGGNNEKDGKPKFGSEKAFIIFGVADAISLFTSCTSILMFLSILTSRYAEGDFLKALPKRLLIGLLTLFVSVGSMMAAFSSILYLMFGHKSKWILYSVIAPSCYLVAIFARVQCTLIAEIFKCTFMSGIFKRRRNKSSIMSTCWPRVFKRRSL